MRKNLKILFVVLCLVLCACLVGCEKNDPLSEIETTVFRLETAVNGLNVEGVLDCLSSDLAEQTKKLLELQLGDGEYTVEAVLSLVKSVSSFLPFLNHNMSTTEELVHLDLSILEAEIIDDTANVAMNGNVTCGGYIKEFDFILEMERDNGQWLITALR